MQSEETYNIIGAAMEVHRTLGQGFNEYVYQDALEIELGKREIPYEREKHITIEYKGQVLKHDYYADFLCYDSVIVELKAVSSLTDDHRGQIIHYLKATGKKLGLLLNFGERSLKIERFAN